MFRALAFTLTLLRWIFLLVIVIFAVTSLLWKIWLSGALLVVVAQTVLRKKYLKSAILILAFLITLPLAFNQASNRMDYLGNLIRTKGAEALHTTERVSIYLFNISMAIGGFIILAPEVAAETLFLIDPRGKDKHFVSNFAMKSDHVSDLILAYSKKVKNGSAALKSKRIPLRWGSGQNTYSMSDYRVALAVAGGGLFLEYEETGDGYNINCRITIDVKYSEGYKLYIFDAYGARFYIDEAIFSALQELNWLHPYFAHYHWSLIDKI